MTDVMNRGSCIIVAAPLATNFDEVERAEKVPGNPRSHYLAFLNSNMV